MQMNTLGRTGIEVSAFCLGTMTFGRHTDEAAAHAQMDRARAAGINFIDTAEMYPVNPVQAESVGRSEEVLGRWFERTGRRSDWVVATKISGAGQSAVRGGAPITGASLRAAIEASLRRLRTDYIDLYQLHWPNRGSYMFRQNWRYDPSGQDRDETVAHMADVLEALEREVAAGRIRAFGLSNESAWGTAMWLKLAEEMGAPRVASLQNEYSLMCRLADTDLAELMVNEEVGLLPFSPLAAGLLTGKYQGGAVPTGSRMSHAPELGGRKTERAFAAVDAYLALAARQGVDPVHMALAFCASRPFVCATILGATDLAQLDHALAGCEMTLSAALIEEIDATHRAHPMPY